MIDKERLLKAAEFCRDNANCVGCPYDEECGTPDRAIEDDTIAVLREQMPVKPFYCEADDSWGCGNCGETVGYSEFNPGGIDPVRNKYCPNCGRQVKWE